MKEIILGISARCSHGQINELGGTCVICDWEAQLLKKKLPFRVRFLGSAPLAKDNVYSVVGIITDGKLAQGGPIPGFLLDGEDTGRSYDMTLFSLRLEPPK